MAFDIVVLGGGPAGCAAAIRARQLGLRAAMVHFVGHGSQRLPGETLHPGVEPLLRQLGVWEAFSDPSSGCILHRHEGIWRESINHAGRTFQPYGADAQGPWLGFQVDRQRLHELLRQQASKLGASIYEIASLNALQASLQPQPSVQFGEMCLTANYLLDATGRRAWLAEQLGLPPETSGPPQRLKFGWRDDSDPSFGLSLNGNPLYRETPTGWEWQAPLGNDTDADGTASTAWVTVDTGPEATGIDYTCQYHPQSAGPNYFLLGDAACLLDPSAANGVIRALLTGNLAAHLIHETQSGQKSPHQAARQYREWIKELFLRTLEERG